MELSFRGTFAPGERKAQELSFRGTFAPVELLLLAPFEPSLHNQLWHYPTLAPPGGLTLHIEKLLNSSFSINLLCLKDLAPFSYIYPIKEPSLNR